MATFNSANNSLQNGNKTIYEVVLNSNESKYSAPFELAVARGKVPGITGLSISGYSPSVNTSWQPIWEIGGPYTYFASAQVVRVWSDSESDTNISVLITGLDSNYVIQTETVTLTNGSTGVLSTKEFLRINNLSITGTVNAIGTVRVGSSDKSITLATVVDGAGRSQMTIYTVPAGYTFYLTQSNFYTNQNGNQYANYRSFTQTPAGLTTKILQFPFTTSYNSLKVVSRPYPEKTDIQWQCQASATSQIGGQIEGYLVSNSI
jgi:hypothetical protein